MKEIAKLYLDYLIKKQKAKLLSKALDQRKWIISLKTRDEPGMLAEIDDVINKIGKANLS